jgi:heavy metal efflux system protein
MLENIIGFSMKNKLIVLLFTGTIIAFGLFSITRIPIGAVPDITNNQVQVITTSRNLSTQDVEQFITYPVELEMANLPGVKEIRSVSKFGLSVVTIVFDDRLGTYLPRQLIAEKLKSAAEKIPEGFGVPEMGPITTGLGEIYQYILDTKPGFDSLYSPMELRTIQDWVVKRQLSGVPGVVEVNTWGGYLKQYEVAVDPDRLQANGLTIQEVYAAMEQNNSVAGGGYIEKNNQSYFIRGEGLAGSLEDLRKMVVKTRDGIPLLVSDIATVGFGHATRFGAITGNGEGEKVLGQVMMLKNANSKKVINAVKERVAEIQKTLPEGVYINPFLERSLLIGKTTKTVAENLILGFLIVAFVVILLIGDYRSGLVVATVIPMCLLFAISMMYIFGIDANLMSLGAIDFGIIIDGAVIIVEFIAFHIAAKSASIIALAKEEQQERIDKLTYDSTIKMLNSAVFGQLIILIVFIPILSLTGVEGKMFSPMALSFCFAVFGAMLLCFTYVPVMSSIFLKPKVKKGKNISVYIMNFLHWSYEPVLKFAMNHKKLVLGSAFVVFFFSIFIFGRLGGEFIPTLDEGDFVIQPVLPIGTSLSATIEITTKIEKILKEFPEVEQVVSRIGAAEVPTDPMSMEESDIIVTLKPIREWTSAKTKDELADKFKEALAVMPGYELEFTQPIEMRFNELITGVRADVAVKIYGEDLGLLARKAEELKELISNVEGASDIIIEKVEGLPQMSVKYNREKLSHYGITVSEANQVISMGFAGLTAGTVFEGQKRFDLIIKLEKGSRKDLDNLRNLMVPLSDGRLVPLRELADINITTGPAKISRDQTKRRIVVGINVRNRDMESVVNDVQAIIGEKLTLPSGYYISYGGQYQNLRNAKNRLIIAVPVALLLIFILLHFAFRSFQDASLIFSAIPLSAVGGILMLWIRGMPFSISAGVGFIALFGIAVLNGIVLIEHLKELKKHGVTDIRERIILGTRQRLRPVVMTATAAALGFLPMAISTSAGAEVQRPLASVVIGGLITSTLLTMIIVPLFYMLFDKPFKIRRNRRKRPPVAAVLLLLVIILPRNVFAQEQRLTRNDAVKIAWENNPGLKAAEVRVKQAQTEVSLGFNPDKTGVYYNYDQNNIAENGLPIKVWGIRQSFQFPTVYSAQTNLYRNRAEMEVARLSLAKREIEKQVCQKYDELLVIREKVSLYAYLDSLYEVFARGAALKYKSGESNYLEKLTSEMKRKQIDLKLQEMTGKLQAAREELTTIMGVNIDLPVAHEKLQKSFYQVSKGTTPSGTEIFDLLEKSAEIQLKLEKNKLFPDIELEYFQGTNKAPESRIYRGFQAGFGLPMWFGEQKARISSARLEREHNQLKRSDYLKSTWTLIHKLQFDLSRLDQAITIYENGGEQTAAELMKVASLSFSKGEIDFYQFLFTVESSVGIQTEHLDNLLEYNSKVYELKFLLPSL